GSGFSFPDLGADRSGVRLAELALADAQTARAVQNLLAASPAESAFMADFRDLPEGLDAESFAADYGDTNSPAYQAVVDEIDRRIDAIPLFRTLNAAP